MEQGEARGVQMFWSAILDFLIRNWPVVTIFLFLIVVVAFIKFIVTGRWAMLGSVLYTYLYLGILFVVGLVWGPVVFISNWFGALCAVVFYQVCYFVVGAIFRRVARN